MLHNSMLASGAGWRGRVGGGLWSEQLVSPKHQNIQAAWRRPADPQPHNSTDKEKWPERLQKYCIYCCCCFSRLRGSLGSLADDRKVQHWRVNAVWKVWFHGKRVKTSWITPVQLQTNRRRQIHDNNCQRKPAQADIKQHSHIFNNQWVQRR